MNLKIVIGLLLLLPAVMFTFGQACSDARLSKGVISQASTAGISFCTTPPLSIKSNLKYIFVIDHSGSNQDNYVINPVTNTFVVDPAGGTDKDGAKRYPPLVDFLTKIQDNANTFYSVINFSSSATVPGNSAGPEGMPWENTSGNNKTRNTSLDAINYLNSEQVAIAGPPPHPRDGGSTNYTATLDALIKMIGNDIAAAKSAALNGRAPIISSDYVIFWVSDGAPFNNNAYQPKDALLDQVRSLLALRQNDSDYVDSITLNTGFYHAFHDASQNPPLGQAGLDQDALAADYMSAIATEGQGVFIDFQSSIIDYTRFSVPVRTVKFQLKDIWIQNANVVWWNGQAMLDSDADGIPDDIEVQLGSNPNKYDSDNNGVGDGVEYYLFGKANNNGPTGGAANYPQCNNNANPPDIDKDFLNDCEEKLLGSRQDDFDSNQDYIPDQFAWINRVGFVQGVNDILADPDGDGVTNYFELKYGLPTQYANSGLKSIQQMRYNAQVTSDNSVQTCYNLNVDRILTISPNDNIRVYLMEARGAVGTHRLMRVANKKISRGNLILTDSDFTR